MPDLFRHYVYAIGSPCRDDKAPWTYAVKVGRSRDPQLRLLALQIGNPSPMELIASVPFLDRLEAAAFERRFHLAYDHARIGGEWFAFDKPAAIEALELFLNG